MLSWWTHIKASRTMLLALLTPLLCLPLPIMVKGLESRCAYVLIVMGVLWITETVPLSATAFLPIVLLPMMGVMRISVVTKAYMSDTLMMGMGALQVAIAVEKWNLHKRIALRILLMVGSEPRWLMLGLMFATWFLSMWISNTATTAMMIPITEAILQQIRTTSRAVDEAGQDNTAIHENAMELTESGKEDQQVKENGVKATDDEGKTKSATKPPAENDDEETDPHYKRLCTGMSLSICYAANCGGIATLTGTGPNLIMKNFADELYEEHGEKSPLNFATWMGIGLPLAAIMMIVCWIWLQIAYLRCQGACQRCRKSGTDGSDVRDRVKGIIRREYDNLGPISFAEGSMLFWFVLMVVLWVSRDLGGVGGWEDIFEDGYLSGSTVSVTIAFILYFYPSTPPAIFTGRRRAERHNTEDDYLVGGKLKTLLTWDTVHEKMPWGLYILLGGGFALAEASQVSGLSQWIGDQLSVFSHLDRWGIAFILCYITAATTEVTSNSAIITLLVPILSSLAISTGVHPLYYLFAGTFACSFAYMLPIATAPNAIVFSYGRVRIIQMVISGIVLNILAVPVLVVALGTWGDALFDFQNPPAFFFSNSTSSTL